MPPAASTPPCPVPGPNNSPGLLLGLGLGLGWSLALLPAAQAASITQTVLRGGGTTIGPRLCPLTPSLVPFPPAWGFRILCPMDKRKEALGCWLKQRQGLG